MDKPYDYEQIRKQKSHLPDTAIDDPDFQKILVPIEEFPL